jgi:hypothetical protein
MNDKELLRLAAKAVGIEAVKDPNGVMRDCTGSSPLMNIFSAPEWNPITDDGDALRLAVKLHITPGFTTAYVITGVEVLKEYTGQIIQERLDANPYAATRRAIVRAAAEIGKAMK